MLAAVLTLACTTAGRDRAPVQEDASTRPLPAANVAMPTGAVQWVALGGGGVPADYQISIEQDLDLAREALPQPGIVLFAGGADANVVQVHERGAGRDDLLLALGDLFSPRPGRGSRYQRTRLPVNLPATKASLARSFQVMGESASERAFFYFAGHGTPGSKAPAENGLALWEQEVLGVKELAALLDQHLSAKQTRLVVTSCFSGGFAEVAFADVSKAVEATPADRCGFFATTWKLPAAGCDPNPDRKQQNGYGVHFFAALHGKDRHGDVIEPGRLDLDDDRRISLLEAHTWTRLASSSANIPVTTSERYLRATAQRKGRVAAVDLPEDERVIAVLWSRLGVAENATGSRQQIETRLEALRGRAKRLEEQLSGAKKDELAAYRRASAEVLNRYPYLDDPYHPRFAEHLEKERAAIASHLRRSELYLAYRRVLDDSYALEGKLWQLRTEMAPLANLLRALETRELAGRLKAKGGPGWRRYQKFLACERGVP
jgi:hypothetical protein